METRDAYLLQMRPSLTGIELSERMMPEENFQNRTLRPIIHLQHDLLLMAFKHYIGKHKNAFYEKSISERMQHIEVSVQKDVKFRNSLKGMIIGQFTSEEYKFFTTNSSGISRRMMQLVIQRLQESIQLLEQRPAV